MTDMDGLLLQLHLQMTEGAKASLVQHFPTIFRQFFPPAKIGAVAFHQICQGSAVAHVAGEGIVHLAESVGGLQALPHVRDQHQARQGEKAHGHQGPDRWGRPAAPGEVNAEKNGQRDDGITRRRAGQGPASGPAPADENGYAGRSTQNE